MKVRHAGLFALSFCCACVRFGYDAKHTPIDSKPDASRPDSGVAQQDAAQPEGGSKSDASGSDAATTDSGEMTTDASMTLGDSGSDANTGETGMPQDASSIDGGMLDGGMTDSGAMDSGMLDSGAADSGSDSGTVDSGVVDNCPERAEAIFCDGFENVIDSDPWKAKWKYDVRAHGALSRSTTHVHSGTYALRATTTQNASENSQARYGAEPFNGVMSGELWARAWYYFPSSVTVSGTVSTLVMSQIEGPYFGFSLIAEKTRLQIGSLQTFYPDIMPSSVFPRDAWTCLELHVVIDASAGTFEAYVDGALKVKATGVNTLPASGYTSVDVGIHYTNSAQAATEMYVDDVVAGFQRSGCN